MTGANDKLRSLFLAMLMVFSVFGGTVALAGTAAANAPGDSGSPYASGAFGGDETASTQTTEGQRTEVADLNFSSEPGNVSNVTVNLTAGQNDSSGISVGDIDSVEVVLTDSNGDLIEGVTEPYDAGNTTLEFSTDEARNGTNVSRVQVFATPSSNAADGDVIDAGVVITAPDDTTFEGQSPYDTLGSAEVSVSDTFVSAEVRDTQGNPITTADTGATVDIIDVATGGVVASNLTLNSNGETIRVKVGPGEYQAIAGQNIQTFSVSSGTENVSEGQTEEIDVTLTALGEPKRIVLEPIDPTDASVPADNSSEIRYRATVFGQLGTQTDVRLSGVPVEFTDNGNSITLEDDDESVTAGSIQNTTDQNGETFFTAQSPNVQSATVTATVTTNTSVTDTAPARFGVLSGEGTVPGQVFDKGTTSGLEDATVYGVTSERYRQNSIWTGVDFGNNARPGDTVFFRVLRVNGSTGDVKEVVDNDEYEAEVAAPYPLGETGLAGASESTLLSDFGLASLFANKSEIDEDSRLDIFDGSTGVEQWEEDEWVGLVDELNTTDSSVGSGFFAVDRDNDEQVNFLVTPLEAGNYTVQVIYNETNASRMASDLTTDATPDDIFGNDTTYANGVYAPENLTSAAAAEDSSPTGPSLIDLTDEDGDFLLSQLYTNGTYGVYYTLIAEKAGYDRDFGDVLVQEDGYNYEDESDEVFELDPRDIEPVINVTNVALLPNANVALDGDAANVSSYDDYAYSNQTDRFSQAVPRDGSVVDVVRVNATAELTGEGIDETVTVSVPDDFVGAGDANASNFEGEWIAVAGGSVVDTDEANTTITVSTGADGDAILWLQSDLSSDDLDGTTPPPEYAPEECSGDFFSGIVAQSTTDVGAVDATCKDFIGVSDYDSASVSGIITDRTGERVNNTVTYVSSFRYDISTVFTGANIRAADTIVFITPDDVANSSTGLPEGRVTADMVDDPSDEFVVVQYRWNGSTSEIVPGTLLGSDFSVTRDELGEYDFPSAGTAVDGIGFPLINAQDEYKLAEYNGPGDSEHTLKPVPAVGDNAGPDTTAYNVRGVGLQTSPVDFRSELSNSSANVKPGFNGEANLAFDFNLTAQELSVQDLSAPSTAEQGETITVTANVSNLGALDQLVDVEFRFAGSEFATEEDVDIPAGETVEVSFPVTIPSDLATGTYTHGVFAGDASQEAQITIEAGSGGGQSPAGTSQAVFDAIASQNDDLDTIQRQDILDMVSSYVQDPDAPINGEVLSRQDVLDLVEYYVQNA